MRKTLIVLAALLACGVARAAEPDLTVEQALNISAALRSLDTYEAKDKDGKYYAASYTFSGVTRMAIAVDLEKTSSVLKTYQATVNEVIRKLSGGGAKVPPERMAEFNTETTKMLAAPAGISLTRIKQADLKLDENPIPGSVLGLLLPIIDR